MEEKKNELVSIVMATFNGARFLQQQLQTITEQTYRELEIIICDDASTDDTRSIIQAFALKDPRIRWIFNETNLGINKNFEQGFREAKGAFIAIADQDDVWKTEKIA